MPNRNPSPNPNLTLPCAYAHALFKRIDERKSDAENVFRRQPKMLPQHVAMTTELVSGSRQIVHLRTSRSRSICHAFPANSLTLDLMSFTSDCNSPNFSSVVLVAFCVVPAGEGIRIEGLD